MRYDPVRQRKESFSGTNISWSDFFLLLKQWLEWKKNIKVQRVQSVFLCSYYNDSTDWDVWISDYDPTQR